jgi:hypothetical protein
MLVCDVKDTVFQRHPFEGLPVASRSTKPDLMLFEEAYPPPMGFDNNHWSPTLFDAVRVRPILNIHLCVKTLGLLGEASKTVLERLTSKK